jgi:hypothetical protein
MAYKGFDDNTYYVRWCDQCNKPCSEVWPKDCSHVQRKTGYEEAVKAYNARYCMGVEEYYAWCGRTAKRAKLDEAAEYAKKLAGPEPEMEDF